MAPTFLAMFATAAPVDWTATEGPPALKVLCTRVALGVMTTTLVLVIKLEGTVMLLVGLRTATLLFPVALAQDQRELVLELAVRKAKIGDVDDDDAEVVRLAVDEAETTVADVEVLEDMLPAELLTPHCGLYWYSPVPSTMSSMA